MRAKEGSWFWAVLVVALLVLPVAALHADASRQTPGLTRFITRFGDGSAERTLLFTLPGNDTSMNLSLPNGCQVAAATFDISPLPYTEGIPDYPENVTIDLGGDKLYEWAFKGKGYGRFGQQSYLSNATNVSAYIKVPFYQGGTDESLRIRLPRNATVTNASLKLAPGGVVTRINSVAKMQSWAPNQWISTGNQIFVNELNGAILYDLIQFNLGNALPADAYLWNVLFWWGRTGTSFYGQNPGLYSFDDPLGAYQLEENWTQGFTNRTLLEGPAEDINAMSSFNKYYAWNVTRMFLSWDNGSHPNYGLCIHRTQAADRDKWDYSLIPFMTVEHGMPGNVSLKLKGAATDLFSQSGPFDRKITVGDFSTAVNAYLRTAPADHTDEYGTEFVDVPLQLSCTDMGSVNVSELQVAYRINAHVDANPDSGGLAATLNALVTPEADGGNTSIRLMVYTSHAGRLRLSNLSIEYLPPDHWPTADRLSPASSAFEMDENASQEFRVRAADSYDYPLNISWFLDGKPVLYNSANFTYFTDFESDGTHNVTVTVSNGFHEAPVTWTIYVKNVNRAPIIGSFYPPAETQLDENSSIQLRVNASDPDRDAITCSWWFDDRPVGSNSKMYTFQTDYSSAGPHLAKVVVRDKLGMTAELTWTLTVRDINAPPEITASAPAGGEVAMNEGDTRRFTVTDLSVDGDPQTCEWYLDGNATGTSTKSYAYAADFNSSGRHLLDAVVSDGSLNASRRWNITVRDVNRPPVAEIDAPADGSEFMERDNITLRTTSSRDPDGDPLNFTWTDGNLLLGHGPALTVRLERGKHLITLSVSDGKANGAAMAQAQLTVRYLEFEAVILPEVEKPVEGTTVTVRAQLTNVGDGSTEVLQAYFYVDGVNISGQNLYQVRPGKDFGIQFPWKAVKGEHLLELRVLDQNFTYTIKVSRKPEEGQTASWIWPVVAMAAVAAGAAVLLLARRKRPSKPAPSSAPPPSPKAPGAPPQPAGQYRPGPPEGPAKPPPPPPGAAASAAPAAPAPAMPPAPAPAPAPPAASVPAATPVPPAPSPPPAAAPMPASSGIAAPVQPATPSAPSPPAAPPVPGQPPSMPPSPAGTPQPAPADRK